MVTRREVDWNPDAGKLVVGGRIAVLDRDVSNEAVLDTYLDLVADQRSVPRDLGITLRQDDIEVLAELLDLDDTALEADLVRLLGITAPVAIEIGKSLRRQRMQTATAALVGTGLLVGVAVLGPAPRVDRTDPAASIGAAPTPAVVVPSPRTAPTPAPTSVDFVRGVIGLDEVAADGGPAPAPATAASSTEPPVVPAFDPDGDIGHALVIERDPADVPRPDPGPTLPDADIGDALVIERDPADVPPAPGPPPA
jgi:hypothetical protein